MSKLEQIYNKPSYRLTITCDYDGCKAKATRKIKMIIKTYLCDEHAKIICEGIVFPD